MRKQIICAILLTLLLSWTKILGQDSTVITQGKKQLNITRFNQNKEVYGWYSGKYIDLHWDPRGFQIFTISRKVNDDTTWVIVGPRLQKSEYFDLVLSGLTKVSYKVKAISKKGNVLKTYKPITFQLSKTDSTKRGERRVKK